MRIAITALAATLALAGCQTADSFIQRNLPDACAGVELAHEAFLGLAVSFQPSPAAIKLESDAYDDAVALCANPGTNTVQVVAKIAALGARIYRVIADERAKHPAAETPE